MSNLGWIGLKLTVSCIMKWSAANFEFGLKWSTKGCNEVQQTVSCRMELTTADFQL